MGPGVTGENSKRRMVERCGEPGADRLRTEATRRPVRMFGQNLGDTLRCRLGAERKIPDLP